MAEVYSHSRLKSFENCPRQFHFRYVLQWPSEFESIEAFVGKRVHEVLERLYRFVREGRVPGLEQVLQRFRADFDEAYEPDRVRIVREGTPLSHYRQLGERCLRVYYLRHYPFDREETLGIEEHVEFALDDAGEYRMQGFIDRVVRTRDGTVEIQDYKTGRWIPNRKQLESERQLALYQLGLGRRYGDAPVRLVWHYLQRGVRLTDTRSAESLEALRESTIALIDEVRAEKEFPARKQNLCDWCEFRSVCPAWTERPVPAPPPRARRLPPPPGAPRQLSLL